MQGKGWSLRPAVGEFRGREPPARDKRDAGRPTTASGRRKMFSEEGEPWEERDTETGRHRDREKRQGDKQRQRDRETKRREKAEGERGVDAGGAEGGFQAQSNGKRPAVVRRWEDAGGP